MKAPQGECPQALSKTGKGGWVSHPMGEAHVEVDNPRTGVKVLRKLGKSQALVAPCPRPPSVQLSEPTPFLDICALRHFLIKQVPSFPTGQHVWPGGVVGVVGHSPGQLPRARFPLQELAGSLGTGCDLADPG